MSGCRGQRAGIPSPLMPIAFIAATRSEPPRRLAAGGGRSEGHGPRHGRHRIDRHCGQDGHGRNRRRSGQSRLVRRLRAGRRAEAGFCRRFGARRRSRHRRRSGGQAAGAADGPVGTVISGGNEGLPCEIAHFGCECATAGGRTRCIARNTEYRYHLAALSTARRELLFNRCRNIEQTEPNDAPTTNRRLPSLDAASARLTLGLAACRASA